MLAYAAMAVWLVPRIIAAIDEMMARIPERWAREHANIADGYLAMPLEVLLRFGRWAEVLAAPEPDPAFPLARALRRHARAVAFAAQDRLQEARAERQRFREDRARVAATATFGNNKAADLLDVAEHFMDGEVAYRAGHTDEALAGLREAVRRMDLLRYSEPPDWIIPVRHALGAALMQSGRIAEAERVYRDDLGRHPDNGWSLFGLSRSLELQGKNAEASQFRARWDDVWRDADVILSSSCFCMPGI
jgi:tetratricopeptide (TPR) repeat protein